LDLPLADLAKALLVSRLINWPSQEIDVEIKSFDNTFCGSASAYGAMAAIAAIS